MRGDVSRKHCLFQTRVTKGEASGHCVEVQGNVGGWESGETGATLQWDLHKQSIVASPLRI